VRQPLSLAPHAANDADQPTFVVVLDAQHERLGELRTDIERRNRRWWSAPTGRAAQSVREATPELLYRDHVEVEVGVGRWGTASFDLWFTGRVADRPAFTATITYVGVRLGSTETMATPAEVRTLLGDPVAAPPP